MSEIGVRELKIHAGEILRRVRLDKESFQISYRGRVIARIVPVPDRKARATESADTWKQMDELAEEIAAEWPAGETAADAVAEQRR